MTPLPATATSARPATASPAPSQPAPPPAPKPTPMPSGAAVVLAATAHSVARLGRSPAENEDSCAIRPELGRFAVADGASTSARPEVWSRLLVDAYAHDGLDPLAPDVLRALRERWWAQVSRPGLPWFARAKLQSGADASFLGLSVDVANQSWTATCVGDSCVFHLRDGETRSVGPVGRSSDFTRFAELVGSHGPSAPEPTLLTGELRPGDVLVLATDALARLLLHAAETRGRMPSPCWLAQTAGRFSRAVAAYRHHGYLADDDTTICVVQA
ncbi:PPM-type phosphatase domain-containing protein [Frankia sp. Hr75.2]|nr:PPM-type phosphatase domain-containing protein [Frankia sp. Hr75.2]